MPRAAILALTIVAGCNPAQVDPPPAPQKEAAKPAAPRPVDAGESSQPDAGTITDDFAAMGQVPCVTRAGWRLRDCTAGLVRRPDGSAVVTIFHPEGRSRDIAFDPAGRATGVATAEQDGSDRQPFSATRRGTITVVRLGPERYDIPDSLVRGR
jgi:hypothetical protein